MKLAMNGKWEVQSRVAVCACVTQCSDTGRKGVTLGGALVVYSTFLLQCAHGSQWCLVSAAMNQNIRGLCRPVQLRLESRHNGLQPYCSSARGATRKLDLMPTESCTKQRGAPSCCASVRYRCA